MSKKHLIDLDKKQLALLDKIIKRHIPNKTVWVYGSRVTWKASEISDLDLVVFDCGSAEIADLKEELEESDLLISVDVMDWENIPDNFKKNISKKYVVLQEKLNLDGWLEVKLGDVAEVTMGQSPKSDTYNQTGSGLPFYQGVVDFGDRCVAPRVYCSSPIKIIESGDILLSVRAPVGKINFTKEKCSIGRGNAGIRHKNGMQDFLFYILRNSEHELQKNSSGSVFASINKHDIESLKFICPPLPEQKAIAEVLSSLDDNIDLLHRQNKTLEDMAQTLFRQWVIEEADESWEEVSLDEIAEYLNGLACQKHPPENEIDKLPVLKIKELRNGISESSDYSTSKVDEKYIVNLGDVIFSWSGSLMIKIWYGQKCVLNQHLFKITSEKYPKWFYYFWTKHHLDKFIGIADSKATTMGHIKRSDISGSMALIPTNNILEKMDRKIAPLFEKILLTNKQISPLENLRDTLLPKLMRGDIRVKS